MIENLTSSSKVTDTTNAYKNALRTVHNVFLYAFVMKLQKDTQQLRHQTGIDIALQHRSYNGNHMNQQKISQNPRFRGFFFIILRIVPDRIVQFAADLKAQIRQHQKSRDVTEKMRHHPACQ